MICPACKNDDEMAFSALIYGFVCLKADCGLELAVEPGDAKMLLAESTSSREGQRIEERVFA